MQQVSSAHLPARSTAWTWVTEERRAVRTKWAILRSNRRDNELRRIEVTPGYNRHAEGSALVKWGDNIVVSTVSIEQKLPPHLRGKKGAGGWLTAEYSLLPRSTEVRVQRERLFSGGRSQEIQRLLGRTFRSVLDLQLFPNRSEERRVGNERRRGRRPGPQTRTEQ